MDLIGSILSIILNRSRTVSVQFKALFLTDQELDRFNYKALFLTDQVHDRFNVKHFPQPIKNLIGSIIKHYS